jgi:hypothetical protein
MDILGHTNMKKYYFSAVALAMLLLSIVGFSDNLFTDIGQESNSDPKFIIHGVLWFAWFGLLLVQSRLIRIRDVKAHMKWGLAGMFIAIGLSISTIYVFISKGFHGLKFYEIVNRLSFISFLFLVALAYMQRKQPALHKRYLFLASVYNLGPVLDRTSGHLGFNPDIFNTIIWLGFFFTLFRYDQLVLGRIHPVSIRGFFLFLLFWLVSFPAEKLFV